MNKARFHLCFLTCLILLFQESKGASFTLSPNCRRAYSLIWSYKLSEAQQLIQKEKISDAGNLFPVYLEGLSDFIRLFASGSRNDLEQYFDFQPERLSKLSGNDEPYSLFCQAELELHTAILHLREADYLLSARHFHSAYMLLEQADKKYPAFLPARRDLLIMQAVIGTVPDNYRYLLNILGFKGDLKTSVKEYRTLLIGMEQSEYDLFLNDSRIYFGFMNFYLLNNPAEAYQTISSATRDYATNALSAFIKGTLSLRMHYNDSALAVLLPWASDIPPLPHLDYMQGIARLQKAEPAAAFYLARYLKNYTGQHFVKDAYLKMGWAFLLAGGDEEYRNCMALVGQYGSAHIEEDRNALREAQQDKPLTPLLRARLLFDGGYYLRALAELQKIPLSTRGIPQGLNDRQISEYYYRLGRIDEMLDRTDEALKNYKLVIEKYASSKEYFAPAACFFSAAIYERQKDISHARELYQKVLTYTEYPYKDSFDQKAYAGLERIK